MKFGRLTFIQEAGLDAKNHQLWLCRCDCGSERVYQKSNVTSGQSKSCGCLRDELAAKRATKHGGTESGAYKSWQSMRQRCFYEKSIGYARYGGRGISVCERWVDSFENFLEDMGQRPEGSTLDRIDPNGDYEPGNCRWLSRKEQNRNRRDNRLYEFRGAQRTIPEIAEMVGIKESTLRRRLCSYGYSLEEAVGAPVLVGARRATRLSGICQEAA